MRKYEEVEKIVEGKYSQKDKRKTPKMHVSGKSVFKLKDLITRKNDSIPKRKNSKKIK